MSFRIPSEMLLLEALKHFFPDSSRRTLTLWIKTGRIHIDGNTVATAPHQVLKEGNTISLGPQEKWISCGVRILYHDKCVIVIDKPAGLLSVPAADKSEFHALGALQDHFKTRAVYPVHRLDQRTSGVLVFARTPEVEEGLRSLFALHDLERYYLAIVKGRMASDMGTWKSYLQEREDFSVVPSTEELGKLAITNYTVLKRSKQFTYLLCKLETGRKHQIRVHCSEAGHPVIGDERYGIECDPIGRMGLHAYALSFIHPTTGQKKLFIANTPHQFKALGFPEVSLG